jgi:PTH1 family peptidyl-tRNA hydrolase
VKLIFGLGNPGERYRNTRHNAGWMVVDALAEKLGAANWRRKFGGIFTEASLPAEFAGNFGEANEPLTLIKPETYMNESGECVAAFVGYLHIPREAMLVVADDVNLPLGVLRLRRSGSDGGHKGLRNVATRLGGEDYPRLRLGVGTANTPRDGSLVDYVLSEFGKEEAAIMAETVRRATDAVLTWAGRGCDEAMNRFNG